MKAEEWISRLKDRLGEWPFRGPEPTAPDASVDPTLPASREADEPDPSREPRS